MKEVQVLATTPEVCIALSGTIDSGNAEEFGAEVLAAYDSAPGDISFECSGLEFIDSTTLGTFVKILKHVKTDGHKMLCFRAMAFRNWWICRQNCGGAESRICRPPGQLARASCPFLFSF